MSLEHSEENSFSANGSHASGGLASCSCVLVSRSYLSAKDSERDRLDGNSRCPPGARARTVRVLCARHRCRRAILLQAPLDRFSFHSACQHPETDLWSRPRDVRKLCE